MAASPVWPVIGVGPLALSVQSVAWAVPPPVLSSDFVSVRWAVVATTVTGAVCPDPITTNGLSAFAPASFVNVPGVLETVTPKVSERLADGRHGERAVPGQDLAGHASDRPWWVRSWSQWCT